MKEYILYSKTPHQFTTETNIPQFAVSILYWQVLSEIIEVFLVKLAKKTDIVKF